MNLCAEIKKDYEAFISKAGELKAIDIRKDKAKALSTLMEIAPLRRKFAFKETEVDDETIFCFADITSNATRHWDHFPKKLKFVGGRLLFVEGNNIINDFESLQWVSWDLIIDASLHPNLPNLEYVGTKIQAFMAGSFQAPKLHRVGETIELNFEFIDEDKIDMPAEMFDQLIIN